ncbi:PaaI family thioesterase [Alicyclobacillus vulcanalis]|nr:PaaI family thioesterase [Alicyclobacillus vulcanalis]
MHPGGNSETIEANVQTFADFIGAKLVRADEGEVVAELTVQPHHWNLARIVHGGVYMSLLDSAMGLLVSLHYPNRPVVTTNLNIHFTEPATEGTLVCRAQFLHRARSTMTVEGRVYLGTEKLCAHATGSFRVLKLPS